MLNLNFQLDYGGYCAECSYLGLELKDSAELDDRYCVFDKLQCIKQRFLSCRTEKIATFFLHRENSYLFPAMIQQQ